MKDMMVLTNNPLVRDMYTAKAEYFEVSPLCLLEKGMEHVMEGWRLVLAPLPPNTALIKSPCRTLVLEKGEAPGVSVRDVILLEKAIRKTLDLGTREMSGEHENLREDYAYMDLDHVRNALGGKNR